MLTDRPSRRKIDHELMLAANVQAHLLPKEIPKVEGYEISALYKPCEVLGGDYYDFITIDQEHLGIAIADISGKGIPAALMMVEARAILRNEAQRELSTKQVMENLNRLIMPDLPSGMFLTALYAILDLKTNVLRYTSCGHEPILLYKNASKNLGVLNGNGIALGVVKEGEFSARIAEKEIQIQPGDCFILNTDGVADTTESKAKYYDRIGQLMREPSQLVKSLEHDLETGTKDDCTVLMVRRTSLP